VTASVALCTFLGRQFLPALLASLAAQTRRPGEVVVCDDASADGTADLVRQLAPTLPFPVHVHVQPARLGSTANFDDCLGRCTGDVIFLADQDDVWYPDKIERVMNEFEQHPHAGLVVSDCVLIDEFGTPLGRRQWHTLGFRPPADRRVRVRHLLPFNVITGAAAAVRRELLDVIRPIPPGWVHDAWAAVIAAAVSEVRLIPDPLIDYRQHAGQQIGSVRAAERVRRAGKRDAAYFGEVAERFTEAAERLEQFHSRLVDPEAIDLLRGKAAFARSQQRMREGRQWRRVGPAVRHLLAGDYHRHTRGWRAFAADLLL
jgi:glycosyltransferase involved in cell wall biosynthesis